MLPLPLQFIVAMVAYAMNERMARRIEYLLAESACCGRSTPRPRVENAVASLVDLAKQLTSANWSSDSRARTSAGAIPKSEMLFAA